MTAKTRKGRFLEKFATVDYGGTYWINSLTKADDIYNWFETERLKAQTAENGQAEELQKENSKLFALLQIRDGGDHDNDCKINYGRQCNCGHNSVKLYMQERNSERKL